MTAPGATAPSVTTLPSSITATLSGGTPTAANGEFTHRPDTWRYPADYRIAWMRSKTAEEVAALSDQMYVELVKRQPPAPPTASPAPGNGTTMPNPDLWLTDPNAAMTQAMEFKRTTEFLPAFTNLANQLGATAREVVKRDFPDDFRKWGPEIDLYIHQMDPQYRTIDNLQKVVGMVRANHIDELADERAKKRLDEMIASGSVLRPGTAPNGAAIVPANVVDFTKLPDNYSRLLQRYGITSETLDEFLTKTKVVATGVSLAQAREEWFKQAQAGDIIVERPSGAIA